MTNLQETANALALEQRKQQEREITQIVDYIKNSGYRATLSESLFRTNFLPFFTGQENSNPEIIAKWLEVAGSPTQEVDIVDIDGAIVSTIPPLVDTSCVSTSKVHNEDSYKNMVVRYKDTAGTHSAVALNRFQRELNNKTIVVENGSQEKWTRALAPWTGAKITSVKVEPDKPATTANTGENDLDFS